MRDDYESFTSRDSEILAIGPDRKEEFIRYWQKERIPYPGLPDPEHRVALLYRQQVNLFKLGRMPLVCIVDKKGFIRFAHYGASMSDIPPNADLLRVIDELNAAS
jgi:peroxiredoxin Q/BCP